MKRSIAIITLVSMINLVIGCTVKQLPLNATEKSSQGKIRSVVFPVTINGYITAEGKQVDFADHTGRFAADSRTILGELPDGTVTGASIDDVYQIRLRKGTVNGHVICLVDPADFLWNAQKKPWRMRGRESVQAGEVIKFDGKGAAYDSLSKVVQGTSIAGDSITAAASDVYLVGKRRLSGEMLIASAALIGVLYLIVSTIDLEWGPSIDLSGMEM